jgi:hypothetical protein
VLGEQEGKKSFGELFVVYYCCKRIKVIKRESYLKLLPIYLATFLGYLSDLSSFKGQYLALSPFSFPCFHQSAKFQM